MKFSKLTQFVLVPALALTASLLITACGTRTIDYVYLACQTQLTNGDGQIQIFAVDSLSGALRNTVPAVDSGGPLPSAEVVSPNFQDLYVANKGNSTVVHFLINSDSSLTQKDVLTLDSEGNSPVALAINQTGTLLYVLSAYEPGCSTPDTCSGTVSVYPLSNGAIGSAVANGGLNYWPVNLTGAHAADVILPTGISVLQNGTGILISAWDQSAYNPGEPITSNANSGLVYSFNVTSSGVLSPATGSPYNAGVEASSVVSDPSNRFVYVTDYASSELIAYRIADGNTLSFLQNGPFKTGNQPTSIIIDPRGLYIYVTNALDNTVSAYSISLPTGTPSVAVNPTGSITNNTQTRPVAVTIEPSLGRDLYTANFDADSISDFTINVATGTIKPAQTVYTPSLSNPVAVVSVAHGNYSLQQITN